VVVGGHFGGAERELAVLVVRPLAGFCGADILFLTVEGDHQPPVKTKTIAQRNIVVLSKWH
jgi:hypothetical protein